MTELRPRIGLAMSGGGFRAMAFGLGALRALHDRDILASVRVVSGISGGGMLTALWAYGPKSFDEFDLGVRKLLRGGLQTELARRAFAPKAAARTAASVAKGIASRTPPSFTRTEALVAALGDRGLDIPMAAVTHEGLDVVLSATDLSNGNAVRFGSQVSASSPIGRIVGDVPVADAASASAAFPLLLPALVRTYDFERNDGSRITRRIAMTDGGVYDNLGVSPLLPRRSRHHTSHVYDLDALIVVDAGRGRFDRKPAGQWVNRTKQTLEISHGRVQDGARSQIHDRTDIQVVHVYLGSRDHRLPVIPDLVPRDPISSYGTNFAAMTAANLEALSVRAEQITRAHLAEYL